MRKRAYRRMNRADQLILHEAYRKYFDICKGKKQTKKQLSEMYNDILHKADMLLLLFYSPSTSLKEKSKSAMEGRSVY